MSVKSWFAKRSPILVGFSKLTDSPWGVLALFGLLTVAVLKAVLIYHKTTFFTNLDNVDQFYSWYQKLAVSVHHGFLPVWNSNVFGGQSFAGELQPGVFYPINILFVWLFGSASGISVHALDYLVALHFVVAAFGVYLLLKEMGTDKLSSFLAGAIFAFSGVAAFRSISQTVIFFGLSLMVYPLFFLLKYHNDETKRKRWLVFSGIMLGLMLLAGHIDPVIFALMLMAIFELSLIKRDWQNLSWFYGRFKEIVVRFVVMGVVAVIVALPQLLVSAQYLPHAYRVQADGLSAPGQKITYAEFSKSFNMDPHEIANLINPNYYQVKDGNNIFMGLLPLGIMIAALVLGLRYMKKTRLWQGHSDFVMLTFVLSGLAMLGYWTWFAVGLYELPGLYEIRETARYSFMFQLALVAVFAISLQTIRQVRLSAKQRTYLALVGGFLFINSIYLYLLRNRIFDRHYAIQTLVLALGLLAFALIKSERLRMASLAFLVLATAWVNTLWFLPTIQANTKTAANYRIQPSLALFLQKTNGQYRVEIEDDSLPINVGNVYNFQTTWGYGATVYAPYYEFVHNPTNPNFVLDMLGVKYEVTRQPEAGFKTVYKDLANQVYVIERASALPKMFSTSVPGSDKRGNYSPLNVQTITYQDQYQKYQLNLPKKEQVIISEIEYPGWVLKIDGKKTAWQAYKINGKPIFRTFNVPAGQHVIEFSYKPFGI